MRHAPRVQQVLNEGDVNGTCEGTVTVGGPHDMDRGRVAVDSGLVVNSFG